ncbi:MAG: DUF4358 domain-containing protein [Clostridia bacterium]|nr:DUF4358 domain-containing protein [Clostridia bacterium]
MKHIIRIFVLCLSVLVLLTACGGNGATALKKGTEMADIMAAVDARFAADFAAEGATGAVAMGYTLSATEFGEQLGLSEEDYTDFSATIAGTMTNSDCIYLIRTKEESLQKAVSALQARRLELIDQYRLYPVSGSYERALASEVYTLGDCAILVCVGILPADVEQQPDFAAQVKTAKEVIASFFE